MSKRRQKGTRKYRFSSLLKKGWLSADVGFTMVERSILKTEGPKINITHPAPTNKNMSEIGMQKI